MTTTATPIPLSCVIRTHNESRMISRMIRPLTSLGAEVVVIDDASTDDTRQKARAAGARVFKQPWLGNGFQKRFGEERAKHHWILDLDADEIVDDTLAESIAALFADGEPPQTVYAIKLLTVPPIGTPWRHSSLAWRNKLYNKTRHRIPEHTAWDQLELPKHLKIPRLPGALLHHSFSGIEQLVNKMNHGSTVRARETKLKPLWQLRLRIIFGLPCHILKKLILQRMILAGTYGFACAVTVSLNRWLKDVKMYEIQTKKRTDEASSNQTLSARFWLPAR